MKLELKLKPVDVNDVINWLEAGAPHVIFDMTTSYAPLEHLTDDDLDEIRDEIDAKPDCGSVCCMAGYITQLAGVTQEEADVLTWTQLQQLALKALNHPGADNPMIPFMLPVFDPDLAPYQATPQEAAAALRNWVATNMNLEFDPWV